MTEFKRMLITALLPSFGDTSCLLKLHNIHTDILLRLSSVETKLALLKDQKRQVEELLIFLDKEKTDE